VPAALARIRIDGDHRVAEEILEIAANRAIDLRPGIADGPIDEVQRRIVRAGEPRRRAAELPTVASPGVVTKLTRRRHREPSPHSLSGCGIVSVEKPARAKFPAGHADDHFVFDDQRRTGDAVAQHRVGHLRFPERLPGPGIERHERGIKRPDEQPAIEQRGTAIERVDLIGIPDLLHAVRSPDLPSALCIERKG
jgi:hypothetical protein